MVQDFYASYRAIIVFPMSYHPCFIIFARYSQLDHTLIRGVKVDIREEAIHKVMLSLNYIAPASTVKCNDRLRIVWNLYIIRYIEHRAVRFEMARYIIVIFHHHVIRPYGLRDKL